MKHRVYRGALRGPKALHLGVKASGEHRSTKTPTPFPIVGIGASAGGLEAVTQLLFQLPHDTGMAFVVIQHLDPTHPSLLTEALQRTTQMPVVEVREGKCAEPNHVYVITPGTELGFLRGDLTVLPRSSNARGLHLPIDFFFRALAADKGKRAIGVVLSGTASDGTEGLKAIKAEGGMTFAQEPRSAKFGGMPASAIAAGVVDSCLRPDQIADEIARLSRHPYLLASSDVAMHRALNETDQFKRLFVLLRAAAGVDFSEYKLTTIRRRLARRMALRRLASLDEYLVSLVDDPGEARALAEDVVIHVTGFFRDADVFDALKASVFPEIVRHKQCRTPIRIWVPGCSTGEEVYSIAIALLEFLGDDATGRAPIQIFGSDVSEEVVVKARAGVYAEGAIRDVDPERLRRFFQPADAGGYCVSKRVRELCVFTQHDITHDPPFAKLDLVSCRNVLIYFGPMLQKRVLPLFHYCLNVPGFLLLGRTEAPGGYEPFFTQVDKVHKIFERTPGPGQANIASATEGFGPGPQGSQISRRVALTDADVQKQADQILLSRYVPPGVLINEEMDILRFRGRTGPYLEPASGPARLNLLKMAHEGLAAELRLAFEQAKKQGTAVRREGVRVKQEGTYRSVHLEIIPVVGLPESKDRFFLVLFQDADGAAATKDATPKRRAGRKATARTSDATVSQEVLRLREELTATKTYLHSLIEDHQRTHDDLTSANEELVSGNEELQSTNEELETTKEELQSANEELITLNEELHNRNQEQNQLNDDLTNLIGSVDIPIVIAGGDRRIRRFTPKARGIMNLIPSDIGRPINDLKPNLNVPDLDEWLSDVLNTVVLKEAEVQDREGRWYRLQIRPYKTTDNRIDGAVLSIVDINALKQAVATAERARDDAAQARAEGERANRAKDLFLATLSHELRTPLSTMLMQAQLLRRGAGGLDEARVQRASAAIERAVKLQAQLIDDLLDVSRIIAGKLQITQDLVDLASIVQAAVETVRPLAEAKSLTIAVALDPSTGRIMGDSVRLQQVLWNLLTNAIKFTPDGGRVAVALEETGSLAQIRVSDMGRGIKPEFLPHLFERFSQADSTTTRAYGGLGLGLALVKHLIELHGGAVRAESPGEGKGATFTITLPLIPTDGGSVGPGHVIQRAHWGGFSTGSPPHLNSIRVLLVEDDHSAREAISEVLTHLGANVKATASAAEAMDSITQFGPDVLLCDIAMPGEDGYSLLRRVRGLGPDRGGEVPAAALTAHAMEEDHQRALTAGFQRWLTKPIDVAYLAKAVMELYGQTHQMP